MSDPTTAPVTPKTQEVYRQLGKNTKASQEMTGQLTAVRLKMSELVKLAGSDDNELKAITASVDNSLRGIERVFVLLDTMADAEDKADRRYRESLGMQIEITGTLKELSALLKAHLAHVSSRHSAEAEAVKATTVRQNERWALVKPYISKGLAGLTALATLYFTMRFGMPTQAPQPPPTPAQVYQGPRDPRPPALAPLTGSGQAVDHSPRLTGPPRPPAEVPAGIASPALNP